MDPGKHGESRSWPLARYIYEGRYRIPDLSDLDLHTVRHLTEVWPRSLVTQKWRYHETEFIHLRFGFPGPQRERSVAVGSRQPGKSPPSHDQATSWR